MESNVDLESKMTLKESVINKHLQLWTTYVV